MIYLNSDSKELGLKINGSDEEELVLKYDTDISELILECSKCGKNKDGARKAILNKQEEFSLRIFIDRSSVEVFVNNGEATMTSRIYPKNKFDELEIYSNGNGAKIKCIEVWKLRDVWK